MRTGNRYPLAAWFAARQLGHGRQTRSREGGGRRLAEWQRAESLESRVLLSRALAVFEAQQAFAVGSSPGAVNVADLNRDGKPDVVVANSGGGTISVLLGNGDGTLAAQQTYAVGASPSSLALADVNGDGKPDVVVASQASNSVQVLLGNGDGTLAPAQSFAVGAGPVSVAIVDLNRDGKPDIVVLNGGDNSVGVLAGNGDGSFAQQVTFSTGAGPVSLGVADVNADGKFDAVVANAGSSSIGVLLGDGAGGFQPQQTLATYSSPVSLAVTDVTRDGKPDITYAHAGTGILDVYRGNGDGTFAPATGFSTGTIPPRSMAITDLNGDGAVEVARTVSGLDSVTVFPGFGNPLTFAVGHAPDVIVVSDLNADGRPDLVVTNQGDGTVSVLRGDVPPTLVSISRTTVSPNSSAGSVAFDVTFSEPVTGVDVSDFSVHMGGNAVAASMSVAPLGVSAYRVTVGGITGVGTVTLNLVDDGTIRNAAGNPLQPGHPNGFIGIDRTVGVLGITGGSVVAADLNGDGHPDIVANRGAWLAVALGNGDATFQSTQTFDTATLGSGPLLVADMNRDGKLDAVIGGGAGIGVMLGTGTGAFQPPPTVTGGLRVGSMVVCDVNGDGKPDVVAGYYGANKIGVLLGNGDGTLQAALTFAFNDYAPAVATADVNGDGRLDLLALSTDTYGGVTVFLGNGDGTFAPHESIATTRLPAGIVAGDFNGDGRADVIVTGRVESSALLLGNGDGTFQAARTLAGGGLAPIVQDINADGKRDVVLVDFIEGGVSALLGNGDGTFRYASVTLSAGPGPVAAQVADFNGDGRPDVVALYSNSRVFSTVVLARSDGGATGPTYNVLPLANTINANATVYLTRDDDNSHIDWSSGTTSGQVLINDPAGLTINGAGGAYDIVVNGGSAGVLPDILHLNGTFTIRTSSTDGTVSLAGKTLDIGRSTVRIAYADPGTDPVTSVRSYIQNGYNGGTWTGVAAGLTGAITSTDAMNNPLHNTGVAWVDSAEGTALNQVANTILLKYAVIGDTDLDGTVGLSDYTTVVRNFMTGASWTRGVVTYDGTVGLGDYTAVVRNFGQALPASVAAVAPAAAGDTGTSATTVAPPTSVRPRNAKHPLAGRHATRHA